MLNESSDITTLHTANIQIPHICNRIRQENVLVREMEFEYHAKNDSLVTRGDGVTSLSLTTAFLDSISLQLQQLHDEVILPLIEQVDANFTLKVKVNSAGVFSFDDLKVIFKIDCLKRPSIAETFRNAFKVLIPFTEYIDYISLRGRDFEITVIETEMNLNKIDLLDVLEMPIVGEKAKKQWFNFAMEASKEAKKEYKLDVVIPVNEGEVTWEIPHRRRLQHIEFFRKGNKGIKGS